MNNPSDNKFSSLRFGDRTFQPFRQEICERLIQTCGMLGCRDESQLRDRHSAYTSTFDVAKNKLHFDCVEQCPQAARISRDFQPVWSWRDWTSHASGTRLCFGSR